MIFSSNIFIFFFLPVFLIVYFFFYKISRNVTIHNLVLIIVSFIFYLWGNGGQNFLIFVISILANYSIGKIIHLNKKPFPILILGISANLAILFYFKFSSTNVPTTFLPIGISFYTFMAISYLIDLYRNKIKSTSLFKFITYLSFFPHIVAGPIVRFNDIEKEIDKRHVNNDTFFKGFLLFSWGLGKKVIIANNIGIVVNKIFALPPSELSFLLAWLGTSAYAIQIYYDFSGYSDMAIGLAQFFGFHFPENFNSPYKSHSITEFWQRWHISLSSWLRDYVYIPLGGNRKGNLNTYCNIFVVFLLCGLWHGTTLTFICWGIYHGIILIAERFVTVKYHYIAKNKLHIVFTFILVSLGWILFRSPTLHYAFSYWKTLFTFKNVFFISQYYRLGYFLPTNSQLIFAFAILFTFVRFPKYKNTYIVGILALVVFIYSTAILSKTSFTPFIYFQF